MESRRYLRISLSMPPRRFFPFLLMRLLIRFWWCFMMRRRHLVQAVGLGRLVGSHVEGVVGVVGLALVLLQRVRRLGRHR